MNPYSKILEKIKSKGDFLDLSNTNFINLPQIIRFDDLHAELQSYFDKREYEVESKGLIKARKAIAKYYKTRGHELDPENIIITASTSESYSLIFTSLLEFNNKILLPNPSYPLFSYLATYARLDPCYYNLKQEPDGFEIDIESIKENIKDTKALVLISPNNPTGMMINKSQIKAILELVTKHNVLLVIDEVFSDYVYENNDHEELLTEIRNYNKTLILNGISKSLASPDLKLAWIMTLKDNADLIDTLETANDTYLNCSYLTQSLLPAIFKKSIVNRDSWINNLNANREQLKKYSNRTLQAILPQGGIHCIIDFPALAWKNEKIAIKLLEEYHLAVHPGYFYDLPVNSTKIIISLLQDPEKFKIALSRLVEFSIKYS
jgi:aspartate/methionine/tyrosine aminotransferase